MYLDSAYIAKFYLNEPDAVRVRHVISTASVRTSSMWAMGEVACCFHRHLREGRLSGGQYRSLLQAFLRHCEQEVWTLIPISGRLLQRVTALLRTLPGTVPLRAGDAIHLTTAMEQGEHEIWTSDRHVLAAAGHFGLAGRSA